MKTKYAWLAGIIDGEGTITITRQRRLDYKSHPYSYRPEVHITNTSTKMILESISIMEKITGEAAKSFPTQNGNRKIVYRVRFQDRANCLKLIKALLPYLVAKKPQAKLLMKFLKGSNADSETQATRIREMNASSSNQEP